MADAICTQGGIANVAIYTRVYITWQTLYKPGCQ